MLPIKEENKFFSRHLTKESSISNPSFRVYYGGNSIAVPFVWEAKPGTPKHTKHNFSQEEQNKQYFPPLTPPPSYYLKQPQNLPNKKSFGKNFLGLFPNKSMHRRQTSSASTLSCPSSSMLLDSMIRGTERSSSLRSSLGLSLSRGRRRTKSNSGSLFEFMVNSQEDDDVRSPRSVLCFGFAGSRRIRSCSIADH
ncbi:uncharacterized protein LOC130814188 [Amaranthus tricolor]|uniref:uncharacterized protein LOC130814188 n=1 Tax=Amaranthus tricolor TaxID=29722 RepID=UPI002584DC60|nr:uncharacterized protein LOC130814188 [Amaranthus tricolor]